MINAPEPRVDPEPDPGDAAGGVDAVEPRRPEYPVTPEPPIGEHPLDDIVPDELNEPEGPDPDTVAVQPDDEKTTSEPPG